MRLGAGGYTFSTSMDEELDYLNNPSAHYTMCSNDHLPSDETLVFLLARSVMFRYADVALCLFNHTCKCHADRSIRDLLEERLSTLLSLGEGAWRGMWRVDANNHKAF